LANDKRLMNILCRVDANSSIGTGHLMRCLALAQHCELKNITVTFLINYKTEEFCRTRNDWVGQIIILPKSIRVADEVEWIKQNIDERRYQKIVLDGYQFDEQYRHQLSCLNKSLIICDDNNNSGFLFATLVINASDHATELDYERTAPCASFAFGFEYRLLRREFTELEFPLSSIRARQYLTIIMGGSDPANVTYSLLQSLEQLPAEMPIKVITGRGYRNTTHLKQLLDNSKLQVTYTHDCQSIAKQFLESKLVVSAAGSGQFEVSACGAAALLVVVADNQLASALKAEESGLAMKFDCRSAVDSDKLAKLVLSLWSDTRRLEHMQCQTKITRRLNSSMNVVDKIINLD